jgi:hypothetical protein
LSFSIADLNHFWGIYSHKNTKKLKILKRFLIFTHRQDSWSPKATFAKQKHLTIKHSLKAQRSGATTAFNDTAKPA